MIQRLCAEMTPALGCLSCALSHVCSEAVQWGRGIVGFQARGPFATYPQADLNRPAVHGRKDVAPAIEGTLRDLSISKNSGPGPPMAGLFLSGHEQPTFQAGLAGPPAGAIPEWTRDAPPH